MMLISKRWSFLFLLPLILAASFIFKANGSEGTIALDDIISEPNIRVLLIKSTNQLDMVTQTAWVLQTMGGEKVMDLPEKTPIKLSEKNGIITVEAGGKKVQLPELVLEAVTPHGVIEIKKVPYGVGWWWENAEDRTYEGRLEIRISHKGGMEVVDEMKMEDYLAGVVPSEIGSTSPQEALRAQAVAARSEALMALVTGKYAGPNNDIGSDV
nr:SpoIID/LytB domain-containing protein [Candidatus Sumerlaeota bacterium]